MARDTNNQPSTERTDTEGRQLVRTVDSAGVDIAVPTNTTAALLTLTAAFAAVNSADQTNLRHAGVQVGVNITSIAGTTPTVTVTIQGKDAASGAYFTLLTSAALAATGFTLLTVYPGALTTANVSTPQPLPLTWRVSVAIGGTSPLVTATIGASLIL